MRRWAVNQRWIRAFTIIIGLITIAAVTSVKDYYPKPFEWAELKTSDLRVYGATLHKPTGNVVIAAVDDKSIAALGRFPWPRRIEAQLVRALGDYRVAAVGFDIAFSEKDPDDATQATLVQRLEKAGIGDSVAREAVGGSNDSAFGAAIKQQGSTFLGYFFQSHMFHEATGSELGSFSTRLIKPWPVAYNIILRGPGARQQTYIAAGYLPPIGTLNQAARGTAYVDIDEDSDGTARSDPVVVRFDGRYCAPLFLAMADAYLGWPPLTLRFDADGVSAVEIGIRNVAVNERGDMIVHFRGTAGTMPRASIIDILAHRLPAAALAHKAVVVGLTAHAVGDRIETPLGGDFPGVEFQATAVDNVLAGDFVYHSLNLTAVERLSAWFMGAAAAFSAAFMTALSSALVIVALAACYIAYTSWELSANGRLVGIIFPAVTLLATYFMVVSYRYFAEGKEKRFIRSAFELYVHPDYVASLMKDSRMLKLGGERSHLSILFADIMGFTSRAERSDPEPLVAMLNAYMTVMTNVIFETGGVVDKLMGDGIMAFWGAPLRATNPARDAINCAIRMQDELKQLAARDSRFSDIRVGIGIATGEVIVGNFGGERKFDYSVIGDTVNLASRLEGLTRQFKVNILVNKRSYDEAAGDYVARQLGLVRVKGKDQLVAVVEIVGRAGDGVDPMRYQRFSNALALLRQGQSPETELRMLQREWPDDHVIQMCLERLQAAEGSLLRDFVFEFDSK